MSVFEKLKERFAPQVGDERQVIESAYFAIVDRLAKDEDVPIEEIEDVLIQLDEPAGERMPDCVRVPGRGHEVAVTRAVGESDGGDTVKYHCNTCAAKWSGPRLSFRSGIEAGLARLEADIALRKRRQEWAALVSKQDEIKNRRDALRAEYDAVAKRLEEANREMDEANKTLWPQLEAAGGELNSLITYLNFLHRNCHDDWRIREFAKLKAELKAIGPKVDSALSAWTAASGSEFEQERREQLDRLEQRKREIDERLPAVLDSLLKP